MLKDSNRRASNKGKHDSTNGSRLSPKSRKVKSKTSKSVSPPRRVKNHSSKSPKSSSGSGSGSGKHVKKSSSKQKKREQVTQESGTNDDQAGLLSPRVIMREFGAPRVSPPNLSPPRSPSEKARMQRISAESTTVNSPTQSGDENEVGSVGGMAIVTTNTDEDDENDFVELNSRKANNDSSEWIDIDEVFDKIVEQASSRVPEWLMQDTQVWELSSAISKIRELRGSDNSLVKEMEQVLRDLLFERYAYALSIRRSVRVLCQQQQQKMVPLSTCDSVFSNVASFVFGTAGSVMLSHLEFVVFLLPWWNFDRKASVKLKKNRGLKIDPSLDTEYVKGSVVSPSPATKKKNTRKMGSHADARKRMGRLKRAMSLRSAVVLNYKPETVVDFQATYGLYSGELVHNVPHGEGCMRFNVGGTYDGQWQNGQHYGDGTLVYKSGSKYSGQWWKGYKHGVGTFENVNGDVYSGHWQTNKKHGEGVFKYASGDVYDGQWYDDKRHGQGSYTFGVSGNVYEGEFVNGDAHGRGVYTYKSSGARYEGSWKDDRRDGDGVLYDRNNNALQLMYKSGKLLWKRPIDPITAHIHSIRVNESLGGGSRSGSRAGSSDGSDGGTNSGRLRRSNSVSVIPDRVAAPPVGFQAKRSNSLTDVSLSAMVEAASGSGHESDSSRRRRSRNMSLSDLPTIAEDLETDDDPEKDDRIREKTVQLEKLEARKAELEADRATLERQLRELRNAMPNVDQVVPMQRMNVHNRDILIHAHQKLEHWQNALLHWQDRLNRLVNVSKNVQALVVT